MFPLREGATKRMDPGPLSQSMIALVKKLGCTYDFIEVPLLYKSSGAKQFELEEIPFRIKSYFLTNRQAIFKRDFNAEARLGQRVGCICKVVYHIIALNSKDHLVAGGHIEIMEVHSRRLHNYRHDYKDG